MRIEFVVLSASALFVFYVTAGYPLILRLLARRRPTTQALRDSDEWPLISISLPVYNEAAQIRQVLDSLLALDYPADRRQLVVISDASNDGTDEIVASYADRGVELLRMPERGGKTAAENAASTLLRGEIVVNTDASIRIASSALKPLVAQFRDPSVGVASGRDISVASTAASANIGEAGYVGYEMKIRALETRSGGIIGASGCYYAIRSHLHTQPLPKHLSRDFASALIAREHGLKAVSVEEAVCLVPRTALLHAEFRRKVRTISRGMETLAHKRHLLNPLRFGRFAWMLFSHKVCRWLLPIVLLSALAALVSLALSHVWARWTVFAIGATAAAALLGWYWPDQRAVPRPLSILTAAAALQLATLVSLIRALRGDRNAAWEPTRREAGAITPTPTSR